MPVEAGVLATFAEPSAAARAVPRADSLILSAMATRLCPKTSSSMETTSGAGPWLTNTPASSPSPRARATARSASFGR